MCSEDLKQLEVSVNSFGEIMFKVVDRAEKISFEQCGYSLSYKYDAPSTIIKMIGAILNTGWGTFCAFSNILSSASYFTFSAALATFLISPLGLVVTKALVYWGGTESIKLLYNNRFMVETVKRIGDKYEPRFSRSLSEEKYDELIEEAATELRNSCSDKTE